MGALNLSVPYILNLFLTTGVAECVYFFLIFEFKILILIKTNAIHSDTTGVAECVYSFLIFNFYCSPNDRKYVDW